LNPIQLSLFESYRFTRDGAIMGAILRTDHSKYRLKNKIDDSFHVGYALDRIVHWEMRTWTDQKN
jgi:hypothetical protein